MKRDLSRHVQRIHMNVAEEKVVCIECNKFVSKSRLTGHKKSFHSEKVSKYKCKTCTFQTVYKDSLEKHQNVHQVNIVICPYCSNIFKHPLSLSIHIKTCKRKNSNQN